MVWSVKCLIFRSSRSFSSQCSYGVDHSWPWTWRSSNSRSGVQPVPSVWCWGPVVRGERQHDRELGVHGENSRKLPYLLEVTICFQRFQWYLKDLKNHEPESTTSYQNPRLLFQFPACKQTSWKTIGKKRKNKWKNLSNWFLLFIQ